MVAYIDLNIHAEGIADKMMNFCGAQKVRWEMSRHFDSDLVKKAIDAHFEEMLGYNYCWCSNMLIVAAPRLRP